MRARAGWLYGPALDGLIAGGPWLLLGAALVLRARSVAAVWLAQFVWGNTTHVVLTFLLLAARRDVLFATRAQPLLVLSGSLATFALSLAAFEAIGAFAPEWIGFPLAVTLVLGIHHRLSQARGIWSLYNLRGKELGVPPPPPIERKLQGAWVSVGLALASIGWLFIPTAADRRFALLQVVPALEAPLPYRAAYGLLAAWLVVAAVIAAVLVKGGARLPKLGYLASHAGAVGLALVAPVWGSVVWGGLHGVEYYFLCARMMRPRADDVEAGLPRWAVWPAMLAAMAPLFLVGLAHAPFAALAPLFGRAANGSLPALWRHGLNAVNALVLAHYFADAFIYRFRIPEVRRVALHRLGFAG